MAVTPWYSGDTAPSFTIQMIPDTGYVDVTNLTTSSFTLVFVDVNNNNNPIVGQGSFSTITAAVVSNGVVTTPASVQYQLASSDVVVGSYHLYLKVSFSGKQQTFDAGPWQVLSA